MEVLADQLHEMLTGGLKAGMAFPTPVHIEVMKAKQEKHVYLESKCCLAILSSDVGSTPEKLLNEVWAKLKYKDTIKKVHLTPVIGGSGGDDLPFDLAKFSEQLAEQLPNVEELHIRHLLTKNFKIESATLKHLFLINPEIQDEGWEIKCPNLIELEMQAHSPPVENFQQALINCPLIETFVCHKYWNEEPLLPFYLPNCTEFTFRRGDCAESLKLYLPRVEEVNLDSNYDLKSVKMIKRGHKEHKEWNLPHGAKHSSFEISLSNTGNLTSETFSLLRKTGRVTNLGPTRYVIVAADWDGW